MAKKVDLRTYILLERAFVRRLQRSWRIQSAPIYAAIAQACNDHQWDKARLLVSDLDMTEVGTHNREWIQYMLLSCAVFGASTVAKKKPSFVGVGSFDTFLKQVTNNMLQHLEHRATTQVQAEALQSIAEDEAKTKALGLKAAWDEAQHPRDKDGQFTESGDLQRIDRLEGGGGPEREKWRVLNQKSMDAFEALAVAKEAHRALMAQADKHFDKLSETALDSTLGELEAKVYDTPELQKAREAVRVAEQANADAEVALHQQEPEMRKEVVTNLSTAVAKKLGISPHVIDVVDMEPRGFTVGDKQFTEAGHFDPNNGRIELNARNISYAQAQAVKGVTAHELSHLMYHEAKKEADAEFQRYLKLAIDAKDQYTPWFNERFEKSEITDYVKQVKPAYREEMARLFPATAALSELADGHFFSGLSTRMQNENGHSAYAKSYWDKEALRTKGYESAITETVAELTRWMTYPSSWHEGGSPQPNSPWVKLTKSMHEWYRKHA